MWQPAGLAQLHRTCGCQQEIFTSYHSLFYGCLWLSHVFSLLLEVPQCQHFHSGSTHCHCLGFTHRGSSEEVKLSELSCILQAVHNVLSCGIMSAFRSNVKHKCLHLFCRSFTCSVPWMSGFCATVIMWQEGQRSESELKSYTWDQAASIYSVTLDHCFWYCNIIVAGCL